MKLFELNDPKSNPFEEQTGLSPETEVMYVKSFKGNDVYKVVGTSDAVILYHNSYASSCGGFYTEAVFKRNYFDEQKKWGREAAKLAKRYGLEWQLVSAIGANDESVAKFIIRVKKHASEDIIYRQKNDLSAGINRRKNAIKKCLGYSDDDYEEFFWIEKLGQKNSEVIANYLLSLY